MSGQRFGWSTNNAPPTCPPPSGMYPTIPGGAFPQYHPSAPNFSAQGVAVQHYYEPIQATAVQVMKSKNSSDDECDNITPAYSWVKVSKSHTVPKNAVVGGKDVDGANIYVGLAKYKGEQLPCKVIDQRNEAYVSWGGDEHGVDEYKVLVENKLEWVKANKGHVPKGAIKAGNTASGEALYVGRATVNRTLTVGKVHQSHGCCYVPFDGKEHACQDYEVLVSPHCF